VLILEVRAYQTMAFKLPSTVAVPAVLNEVVCKTHNKANTVLVADSGSYDLGGLPSSTPARLIVTTVRQKQTVPNASSNLRDDSAFITIYFSQSWLRRLCLYIYPGSSWMKTDEHVEFRCS
jgi:hypothetical protein